MIQGASGTTSSTHLQCLAASSLERLLVQAKSVNKTDAPFSVGHDTPCFMQFDELI